MEINQITEKIIGCAIEVHKNLGPGLLESAYEECLIFELRNAGLKAERQIAVPVVYKDINIKLRGSPYKLKYYNTKKKQTLVLLRASVVYIFLTTKSTKKHKEKKNLSAASCLRGLYFFNH
jgi:hypothetical protein